jgi:hypothetical protein
LDLVVRHLGDPRKNIGLSSFRLLGCAFLVVTGLSFQGCNSSGSGIKPDATTSSGNAAGSGEDLVISRHLAD